MASGSAGRPNSGSKAYDFGTDDILCSYEDYGNQESSNGSHSDLSVANSSKNFHRTTTCAVYPPPAGYGQPEDTIKLDVISTVENSMKKYSDNILRFLEGISSRLSQLEMNCYNLDKSVGEMRSDVIRDHEEEDLKLKSIEKHLQEVHRSVQIIRDKQELAETQKDLAKAHLLQKESSSSSRPHSNEERASPVASDPNNENPSENHNQQLALALPHQIVPHQNPITPPPPAALPQNVPQQQAYYISSTQFPSQLTHIQHAQSQYQQQLQDVSRLPPQTTNSQPSQAPPPQQFNQYQQQWTQQQPPQPVQPPQPQPSMQPQIRMPPSSVYSSYSTNQPTSMPETLPNSLPMQMSFSSIPQPGSSRLDAIPYGYTGSGSTVTQQPPPQVKNAFGPQAGEGYLPSGLQPVLSTGGGYMIYDRESGRPQHHHPQPQPQQLPHHPPQPQQSPHHPPQPQQSPHQPPQPQQHPQFNQSGYPPANASPQYPQHPSGPHGIARNPSHSQFTRNQNHPYGDIVEKLVGMGFRNDHIGSVIHRMEESGQAIDFNAVLDGLSNSGAPQRVW